MAEEATIKDVARMSGVSIGTVDRVLHNRGKVSAQNQQAVMKAIKTLNYHPSQIARALVNRKSNLKIGICIPQVEAEFWADALRGVESAKKKLLPFGVSLEIEFTYNYSITNQKEAVKRLLKKNVNSIILLPSEGVGNGLDQIIPPEIPYATVIEDVPDSRRLFHVGPDDHSMGLLLGRLTHLYAGPGFKSIILAANPQFLGTRRRVEGFCSNVKRLNPTASVLEICDIPMRSEKAAYDYIFDITVRKIRQYPDMNVIYVTNGLTQWAAAAVKSCRKCGKIQVFGYECTEMTYPFIQQGLIGATINQRPAQQWYNAISIMYEYLTGDRKIKNPIFPAECSIIIEESIPFVKPNEILNL